MSYWKGGYLHRRLLVRADLLTLTRPGGGFLPRLVVSTVEFEAVGNYDPRFLGFSMSTYNASLRRRSFTSRVLVAFCLVPEFARCLKHYRPEQAESEELGVLLEQPGFSRRVVIYQRNGDLSLVGQTRRGMVWENREAVVITKEQYPTFKSLLDDFCRGHLREICLSRNWRKSKAQKWAATPPR